MSTHPGIVTRLAAATIDTVLVGAAIFGIVIGAQMTLGPELWPQYVWPCWTVALLVGGAYYVIGEATTGQTIGRALVEIRVVDRDGQPPGYLRASVRTLARVLDANPLWLLTGIAAMFWIVVAATAPEQRRLGDFLAGTRVVVAPPTPGETSRLPGNVVFVAVLVLPLPFAAAALAVGSYTPMPSWFDLTFIAGFLAFAAALYASTMLYFLGSWRADGAIPRASHHQLALPAWVAAAALAHAGGSALATDRYVALRDAFEWWIAGSAVYVVQDSLVLATEAFDLERPPTSEEKLWSGIQIIEKAPLERGIVIDFVDGASRIDPRALELPRERLAARPEEVGWIAFVGDERYKDDNYGEPVYGHTVRVRLVDRDGRWLAVGAVDSIAKESTQAVLPSSAAIDLVARMVTKVGAE